jgi:hypothetical protein
MGPRPWACEPAGAVTRRPASIGFIRLRAAMRRRPDGGVAPPASAVCPCCAGRVVGRVGQLPVASRHQGVSDGIISFSDAAGVLCQCAFGKADMEVSKVRTGRQAGRQADKQLAQPMWRPEGLHRQTDRQTICRADVRA